MKTQVAIVGAGMAGLSCALRLADNGVDFVVLEAADEVGGRVKTDTLDGFLLDRGFQVLLTAYPEAQCLLNYETLQLRAFYPGALVRHKDRFHLLTDPFRKPADAMGGVFSPIGTVVDKLRVGLLRMKLLAKAGGRVYDPETTTLDALRQEGFSPSIIERFFRPFLGGVFLERELETSSSFFEFVFRMFSSGDIAVPAGGMGAIPKQIASRLPPGSVRTQCRVNRVAPGSVSLDSGEALEAEKVVLATESLARDRLLGVETAAAWRATTCLYFSSPVSPLDRPVLVLNGDGEGPVNNLVVLSDVATEYSQSGEALISVTVLGDPLSSDQQLTADVLDQLRGWFGGQVKEWKPLRVVRVKNALPAFPPGAGKTPANQPPWLIVCGDDLETPSLQGAMISGRRAADSV